MSRRQHRKRSQTRRQLNSLLPGEPPSGSSPDSTSSSTTTQSNPPAGGNDNTGSTGNTGDTGITGTTGSTNGKGSNASNDPEGLPIGRPKDPNPLPSIPSLPTSPADSNAVPSVDPFPPNGAKPSPTPSSSSPNVLSTHPVPQSTVSVNPVSSSGASGSSSSTVLLVSSTPTAAVQTPVVSLSSSLLPSNPLSTPSPLLGPHSTITGLLPTTTGNSTATASSAVSTPSIVGIAAGSLCGLAILGAACLWVGKRVSRYMETRDLEPPPMHEPEAEDDSASILRRPSGPSTAPRPPTMIERKQANFSGRGNGFYSNIANSNSFNPQAGVGFPPYADPRFANASPFATGQYYPGSAAPPVQPYFNPIATSSPFDDAAVVTSPPGTPVYFSRQNSIQSGSTTTPAGDSHPQLPNPYDTPVARPNDGYATLNRGPGSVTPQQARQYSDLARQIDLSFGDRTTSPAPSTGSYAQVPLISKSTGVPTSPKSPSFKAVPRSPSVINVPTELHEGRATPVQFGFTDPTPTISPNSAVLPPVAHMQPVAQPAVPTSHPSRPETVYDEEDAYAAI